ncbi:MAG: hypothetical protein J7M05_12410, partial [Anaerolineae bacterium]|nr:hypothetical protein [Anaerolineae bacterium]
MSRILPFLIVPLLLLQFLGGQHVLAQRTSQGEQAIVSLGQVGGPAQVVAVRQGYAFVGMGKRLEVWDVRDLSCPVRLGQTVNLAAEVNSLALSDYYAYVGAGALYVLDIHSLTQPFVRGFLSLEGIEDISVLGNYAYVAAGEAGVRVIDIRSPSAPLEEAFYVTPGRAVALEALGDYLYVATEQAGVRVLDISDPLRPEEASSFAPSAGYYYNPGMAYDICVVGDRAYVAQGWSDPIPTKGGIVGLGVEDVSEPLHPAQLGSYWAGYPYGTEGWASHVSVCAGTAWVAAVCLGTWWSQGCLYSADVSSPDGIQEMELQTSFRPFSRIEDLFCTSEELLLALGGGGVQCFDPVAEEIVGPGIPGEGIQVACQGQWAWMVDPLSLRRIDIQDPSNPRPTDVWNVMGTP